MSGKTWGRSRLTVTYADGTAQTIHYYVTKAASQAVSDLGTFLTTKDWFVDSSDPFGRSPSAMTYDHEASKIVTQTKQAWVCGLGDDGGATWLAGAMKLLGQPVADQVTKYQQFVDGVVWGNLQYKDGSNAYGVKRTLFYYEPTLLPSGYYDSSVQWTDPTTGQLYWGAWSKAHTLMVPRSYNYPHVAALYWTMYRLARNKTGLVSNHTWDWYLNQAYKTAVAMTTIGNEYAQYGLMDGSVFIEILRDLKREALTTQASDLEAKMKTRETTWRGLNYPFGSEMAWDSTGQEEVYGWTRYFGDTAKAKVCIDAITGYMPHSAALGLQRLRSPLLGLRLRRRQDRSSRAHDPPLWIESQRDPCTDGLPRPSRRPLSLAHRLRRHDGNPVERRPRWLPFDGLPLLPRHDEVGSNHR